MSQDTFFEKVRFRNFQSFGNNWTEIDLSQRGTTLIVGENLDEGGSSGAGKTTAMSVVSYCLYDKIPSGVSKDQMVNSTNGKKNTSMEAELTFTKNGNRYRIHRSRGQITGVHLYENDKDITPASVVAVNDAIEELIGFSYNLFSQIVLFQGSERPFLSLSVGDQRALIEELFKITMLTRKANALKKQESETSKAIDMMKVLIEQQEKQNAAQQKHIMDAEDRVARWYATHEDSIKKQEKLLEAIKNIDFDSEEQLHNRVTEMNNLVIDLQAAIKLLGVEKTAKSKETFPELQAYNRKVSDFTRLEKESTKIEKDLVHLTDSKCPYCLQDYAAAKDKISDLEIQHSKMMSEIVSIEDEIQKFDDQIQKFNTAREAAVLEIDNKITEATMLVKGLQTESDELSSVLSYASYKDHVNAKAGINALEEKIQKLREETNPHLDALETLKNEGLVEIDTDSLNELINLQAHQKMLIKLLTDKNSYLRKSLISSTTPFLNKRIGYYLEKLNLPHVVLFQPDMSCEITQFGRTLSHGNLSNGEKKRLNLALCLSFRDVLTYLHSKVNVLFTDEVDGGSLDTNCVDMLISLLKKKAWDDNISIFIISHRPEFEGRCDRNYVVRKEQGFSNLIVQPDA